MFAPSYFCASLTFSNPSNIFVARGPGPQNVGKHICRGRSLKRLLSVERKRPNYAHGSSSMSPVNLIAVAWGDGDRRNS